MRASSNAAHGREAWTPETALVVASPRPGPDAERLVIESVAARYAETSPVLRSKRRALDVLHALDLGERWLQWFFDRRDGFDLAADHAHAMALLPTGELVDLTARQFDPLADYPLVYPTLGHAGRDWKRYQLRTGLELRPDATAALPMPAPALGEGRAVRRPGTDDGRGSR